MIEIKDYPKSKEKLLGFIKGHLETFQKSLLEGKGVEVPPIDPGLVEATMNNILDNNPRSLYNFFDKYSIFVLIDVEGESWSYKIGSTVSGKFSTREHAEIEGFKEAIKLLENG